jgi:hypothetical protein
MTSIERTHIEELDIGPRNSLLPARWSGGTRNWTPVGSVDLNPQR